MPCGCVPAAKLRATKGCVFENSVMRDEIPLDAYVGQPREWLEAREKALREQIARCGGRMIASENDGGLSVSYKVAGTPQLELRAVRYALNKRTAEDLSAVEEERAASGSGSAPGGFVPARFF